MSLREIAPEERDNRLIFGRELGMKNKITVSIAGQEYTMVAEEGEEYVKRCAALVDQQVRDVMNGARLSRADAAVLAAMNLADQFLKEQESGENLRRQIKEGLDENARIKAELSEAKRENFKLQNHLRGQRGQQAHQNPQE